MLGITFPKDSLPSVDEELLILFVTHCKTALKLKYDTIKLYLSGIRFHYIQNNFGDPTNNTLRLSYILRAIKKSQVNTTVKRLPITFSILSHLCNILKQGIFEPFIDNMLQCAFQTAFYGFLRCGEFTCQSLRDNNFLRISDIHVLPDLQSFNLVLRTSKTDPFGKSVTITIFENNVLYPVLSMYKYLNDRRVQGARANSPLFINGNVNHTPLLRHTFLTYLKDTLARIGYDNNEFKGHSFRIGAASSAALAGVEDHVIQILGRWSSDCYTRYIRTSPSTLRKAQHDMSLN